MVNVAHHGYDGGAGCAWPIVRTLIGAQHGFRISQLCGNGFVAHLLHDQHCRVLIKHLVNGHHASHLHQDANHFRCLDRHELRKIRNGNRFRNGNIPTHWLCWLLKRMLPCSR